MLVLIFSVPIDKNNLEKRKDEDGSEYNPSGNEESEDEDGDDEDIVSSDDNDQEVHIYKPYGYMPPKSILSVKKPEKKAKGTAKKTGKNEVKNLPNKRKSVEIEDPKRIQKKKRKSIQTEDESENINEVDEEEDKKSKNLEKEWNSKNLDFNLHNEAPENIKSMKILLSSTVMVKSKMLEANESNKGLSYDMAVMAICRKTRGNKVFEFNLPMSMVPNLREACDLLIDGNKAFYEKRLKSQKNC